MQDDEKTDAFKAALGDADAEIVSREGGTAILAPLRAVAVDVAVLAKLQATLAIPARLSSHASFQVSADGMGSVVAVGTAAPLTDIAAVQASLDPTAVTHSRAMVHRAAPNASVALCRRSVRRSSHRARRLVRCGSYRPG